MLEVLVFHGLAQEGQGATGFPAAVPDLGARAQLGALAPATGTNCLPSPVPGCYLDGNDETILAEGLEEEGAGLSSLLDRHQVP